MKLLEPNGIYQGDCLELMSSVEDHSIDMVLCDLPYGTTACTWDVIIPFESLWRHYQRLCKPKTAVLLFGIEPFSSYLRTSNSKGFRYDWYWHKNRPTGGATCRGQPMKCVETISVFYDHQPIYNPHMTPRTQDELKRLSHNSITKCNSEIYGANGYTQVRKNLDNRYPTNYLNIKTVFSRSSEKTKHPTQKPVALCEYLIRTYTNEGDLVLDNCAGSGTTGVACLNTNRRFILIEKDPDFCEIAMDRFQSNRLFVGAVAPSDPPDDDFGVLNLIKMG